MNLPTLTIGIATYNRKNLLEMMAKSLYMSDLSAFDTHIRIYDDFSSDFDENYLRTLFPTASSITRNSTNLKADLNTYNMYADFLKTDDDYFFNGDSDLIFNKNWLNFIKNNFDKTDGVLTIFNAERNHPSIKELVAENKDDVLLVKEHIGAAGTFFSRKRIEQLLSLMDSEDRKEIDWGFSKIFMDNGIRILCSKKSYVQHIGIVTGQNSNLYVVDYGKNFEVDSSENGQALNDIFDALIDFMPSYVDRIRSEMAKHVETNYRNTIDFKIGQIVLKPFRIIKHLLK